MEPRLQLQLLGRPHFTLDGTALGVEQLPVKGLALLAYLAITGDTHTRAALAGLLWGDFTEETARANLRLTLTHLRKHVGPWLLTTRHDVAFDFAQPCTVDTRRFEQLASATGQPALQEAADLYRGDLLQGFIVPACPDFEIWLVGAREAYRRRALDCLTRLIAAGDREPATAIRTAHKLLEIEPWHEETHRQLMRLYAQSGQRAAALAQYERCRQLLHDEFGVEPAAETVHLYRTLRDRPPQPSAATAAAAPRHNLPAPISRLFGRSAEIARITAHFRHPENRLLTIVGEGGVGKTRLALTVAAQFSSDFPHGAWFVPLESARPSDDPAATLAFAVLSALDLTLANRQSVFDQLRQQLQPRHCLLILDNFESCIEAAPAVGELLRDCAGVTVLATSREPLNITAESLLRLRGLSTTDQIAADGTMVNEAVGMFLERADRAGAEIADLDAHRSAIHTICRLVDGLPLGIELAVGWLRWYTPDQVAELLHSNFQALHSVARDRAARHSSLQAVFDASWQLLRDDERQLLARLAVFPAGFDRAAVQAVTTAPAPLLHALVDKSLVAQTAVDSYQLHTLLRQYADARLQTLLPDRSALEQAFAAHYLAWVAAQADALGGAQPQRVLPLLLQQRPTVDQAWLWAARDRRGDLLARALPTMTQFWEMAGLYRHGLALLEPVTAWARAEWEATASAALGALTAHLHQTEALLLYELGLMDAAGNSADSSLTIARRLQDPALTSAAHLRAGFAQWGKGAYAAAGDAFTAAAEQGQRAGQRPLIAHAWRSLAVAHMQQGRLDDAERYAAQSLQLYQELGDRRNQLKVILNQGIVARQRGEFATAHALYTDCLQDARAIGDQRILVSLYTQLANNSAYLWRIDEALAHYADGLTLAHAIGNTFSHVIMTANYADLLLRLGAYAQAVRQYDDALAAAVRYGYRHLQPHMLAYRALARHYGGDAAGAAADAEAAYAQSRESEQSLERGMAARALGSVRLAAGDWQEAGALFGESAEQFQLIHYTPEQNEALAGQARAALAGGDRTAAQALARTVVAYLDGGPLYGGQHPLEMFVTAIDCLRDSDPAVAQRLARTATALLQERSRAIGDPQLRAGYQAIAAHRRLA